jgi:hypothetical protein
MTCRLPDAKAEIFSNSLSLRINQVRMSPYSPEPQYALAVRLSASGE